MKSIGQMEQLPLEVLEKILSFCSINDRAECRLVSRVLKEAAEISLSSVTHLNIQRGPVGRLKWPKRVENESPKSYSDEIFFHKPLVDVRVKYTDSKELFFFLAHYCPDLQVVSASSFELEYEQLVQIASRLQFFHCMDLLIPSALKDDSESLFAPFEQLKGFQVSDFPQKLDVLFAKYLFKRHRPIFTLQRLSLRDIGLATFELMARTGISCLSIDSTHNAMVQQIPEALAGCLVDLTVESNPPAQFCRCPLPKLQYLRLQRQRVVAESNPLFCRQLTPNLKRFEFDGEVDMSRLRQLMSYIHSLEKLQYASLGLEASRAYGNEDSFPLPPKLTELRVDAILPFRNLSTSLRSLSIIRRGLFFSPSPWNLLSKERRFEFNFPNLEFFQCESNVPKGMFRVFLQSLSKCCKLVTFRLELKLEERADASQVQSLMDIIQQNPRLSHLQLNLLTPNGPGCNTSSPSKHTVKTVFLRQEHFPSLKRVELKLPYEIVYYPTDSFERLEMASVYNSEDYLQEMKLTSKSLRTDFSLTAPSVIPVFSSQMDKLVHLDISIREPQHALAFHSLASQLHKINNLQILQLYYLEPMMESPSLDLVAEHKSHLLELQKVFSGQNFKCFFTQTASNDDTSQQLSLRPADAFDDFILGLVSRPHNSKNCLQSPSPGNLEKLVLRTEMSLDLSALTSQSLSSLEIYGDISVPFDLPNLRHFRLERSRKAAQAVLDSLKKSPQLRTFERSFEFGYREINARFVNSLLQVTSQLKHLETLVLKVAHFSQQVTKKVGWVSLDQKNFPSLTKLFWNLPFHLTFHPLDVFDCIEISRDGYSLRGEIPSLVYEIKRPRSVDIKFENMSKLAKLQIDCSCSLQQLSPLKQSQITEVHLDRSTKEQFRTDVMDWVASLPHLRTVVTMNPTKTKR